jgi:hypothetical protein
MPCDQSRQSRPHFSVWDTTLGGHAREFVEQRSVKCSPVDGIADVGGGVAQQVCYSALDHHDQLVSGVRQAVAQKAGDLYRACWFLDLGASRWGFGGQAPCLPPHDEVGQGAQELVDVEAVKPFDPFKHLADLTRRVPSRRLPQPALIGQAGGVQLRDQAT